jgi:hypothetical protein
MRYYWTADDFGSRQAHLARPIAGNPNALSLCGYNVYFPAVPDSRLVRCGKCLERAASRGIDPDVCGDWPEAEERS